MVWSLEIHHLDVQSAGDATLIVARYIAPPNLPIVKTVLIDGGKTASGNIIHNYLINTIGVDKLDVIAVTHFDQDHFNGITSLLRLNGVNNYDNAIIYDPGKPPNNSKYFSQRRDRQNNIIPTNYQKYIEAIANQPNVTRATVMVNSFDIVLYDANNAATIPRPVVNGHLDPYWLIDKEIMWGNGGDDLNGRPAFASNPPLPGAPTITCITANKYVRQQGGGFRFVSDVKIFNGPRMDDDDIAELENQNDNAKSLGFLIQFNNFRYYVAGDLESVQEDGHNNVNMNPLVFQPGVKAYVNNGNNMAGRVLAMKTSHHGANTASSRQFISQMRPSAAFISTGPGNQFNHPAQRTVNVLDGYPEVPINADAANANRHPPQPPPPPFRSVTTYITGYKDINNPNHPLSYGGDASVTLGDPARNAPGHIKLVVTQAQSQRPVEGQIYQGIQAAATHAAQAAGVINQINAVNIANVGAMLGTAAAVAVAVGARPAAATRALEAMAHVGNDANGIGVITAAVNAGGGACAARAAAGVADAGVARVTAIGNGTAEAIGAAVTGGNAAAITMAAQNAGAAPAAAIAAGQAAHAVLNTAGMEPDDAGFTAAAAIGAANGGATAAQATAIAAAIGATVAVVDSITTATVTTNAAIAAGMQANIAAVAGAVAGAAYYEGLPQDVNRATTSALQAAGIANAANVGLDAHNAAIIAPNDLFTTSFETNQENPPNSGNYQWNYSFTS